MKKLRDRYFVDAEDILYRKDKHGIPKLVIPTSMVDSIIKMFHTSPLIHHLGVNQTYQALKRNVFIPNLARLVRNEVSACHVCLKSKPQQHPLFRLPLCERDKVWGPLDICQIDLAGPFLHHRYSPSVRFIVC